MSIDRSEDHDQGATLQALQGEVERLGEQLAVKTRENRRARLGCLFFVGLSLFQCWSADVDAGKLASAKVEIAHERSLSADMLARCGDRFTYVHDVSIDFLDLSALVRAESCSAEAANIDDALANNLDALPFDSVAPIEISDSFIGPRPWGAQ